MLWIIAITLIEFTGPDGRVVQVNPHEVVSVRPPHANDHYAPGVQCLIYTVDSKFIAVKEACSQVRETLSEETE